MVAKLEDGLGKPVPTTNRHACYEYERREGCSRVAGDEEEDGVDDLEGEFGLQDGSAGHDDDPQYVAESMLRAIGGPTYRESLGGRPRSSPASSTSSLSSPAGNGIRQATQRAQSQVGQLREVEEDASCWAI